MSQPSIFNPSHGFSTFRNHRVALRFREQTQPVALPGQTTDALVKDTLLDPNQAFPPDKAIGLFLLGLGGALLGRGIFSRLFTRGGTALKEKALNYTSNHPFQAITNAGRSSKPKGYVSQTNLSQGSNNLLSFYMMATHDTPQRKVLLAYLLTSVAGYLSGSVVQGMQEVGFAGEKLKSGRNLSIGSAVPFGKASSKKTVLTMN